MLRVAWCYSLTRNALAPYRYLGRPVLHVNFENLQATTIFEPTRVLRLKNTNLVILIRFQCCCLEEFIYGSTDVLLYDAQEFKRSAQGFPFHQQALGP